MKDNQKIDSADLNNLVASLGSANDSDFDTEAWFNRASLYDLQAALDSADAMEWDNKEEVRVTLLRLIMKKIDTWIGDNLPDRLWQVRRQLAMKSVFDYVWLSEKEHDLMRSEYDYDYNFDPACADDCEKCSHSINHNELTNSLRLHGKALCFHCAGGRQVN